MEKRSGTDSLTKSTKERGVESGVGQNERRRKEWAKGEKDKRKEGAVDKSFSS